MRLLLLNHEYPPVGGGAATATRRLAEQLAAAGHTIRVVTTGLRADPADEGPRRLEVVRLATLRRTRFAPGPLELLSFSGQAAWNLTHQARAFGADGILAFFAVPSGLIAVQTAERLGIPLIVSLRGSDVPGFSGGRLRGGLQWCSRPLIRHVLGRAAMLAPNCEHLRELTLRFMPEVAGKTRVVPNGIDRSQLAGEPAGSGAETLHLISVGQLVRRKRVEWVLQAVKLLEPQGVRLTVVGEGPERRRLEILGSRLGIGERVRFVGFQPRDQVRRLLASHDLYVSASRAEGMSNACLEAMAAGLPVVTTANGCHDTLLAAGAGEVADVDDHADFVRALRKFHDVAERQRCARAALAHVATLSWRPSAAELMRWFQELHADRRCAERSSLESRTRRAGLRYP